MIRNRRTGLETFPTGGVHPPDAKLSADRPIEPLPLPATVTVPIIQHIGAPAEPVVKAFERVKVGQLIGRSGGFISANTHASVSGKVLRITRAMDSSGYKRTAVVIQRDGDEWMEGVDRSADLNDRITASPAEIVEAVAAAGVVGMGGAAFPAHVKLSVPEGKRAEFLLINGVECEPFLTCDYRLMLERRAEILVGVRLLMKALGVDRALIGIEANKPAAIDGFRRAVEGLPGVEVHALEVKYPQGAEKQLIEALVGRQVPSGGLPIDVGCVVHNVATAFAVYEAVQKRKPLVERVVCVTGKGLSRPSNFLVRIGTSLREVIEAAGGLPEDTAKLISGGPMMGRALPTPDIPIAKGTSGVLVLSREEAFRPPVRACIRCRRCLTVCPLGLEPYLLMTLSRNRRLDDAEAGHVLDCCECGSCSYICPARRPLLDYIRLAKARLIRRRKAGKAS